MGQVTGLRFQGLETIHQLGEFTLTQLTTYLCLDQLALELAHTLVQGFYFVSQVSDDSFVGSLCILPLPREQLVIANQSVAFGLQLSICSLQLPHFALQFVLLGFELSAQKTIGDLQLSQLALQLEDLLIFFLEKRVSFFIGYEAAFESIYIGFFDQLHLSQLSNLILQIMDMMMSLIKFSLLPSQHISQLRVFLLQTMPLILMLTLLRFLLKLHLLLGPCPLQEILNDELLFFPQRGYELQDFTIPNDQLEELLKQQLKFIQITVFNHPKQCLLACLHHSQTQQIKRLCHNLTYDGKVMHSLLYVATLDGRIPFFHHRRKAQRFARGRQLWDLVDACKEAAMEELWVEEVVDGDVPVCWYDMGYDLAQRVIEMTLQVVHYYTTCKSNSKEDQQSAQLD